MSRPLRSRVLAAALAAAVTVPAVTAVTGTALAAPAAAPRTFLVIWGADDGMVLGPWSGMGIATRPLPFPIPASTVAETRIGCESGYALTKSGQILAWGDNRAGQLGIGTDRPRQISAGVSFDLALTTRGTILAWGDNEVGELGTGKAGFRSLSRVPVAVHLRADRTAVHIGTGWDSSDALAITRSRL